MDESLKNMDQHMQAWYQTELGRLLLEEESARIAAFYQQYGAKSLLHIGGVEGLFEDALGPQTHCQHIALSDLGCGKHPLIIPTAEQKKLRPASFDCIVLTHIAEFYHAPVPLLKDCSELLTAGGYLICHGFNPWSLWGLAHMINYRTGLPWQTTLHAASSLHEWLRGLRLTICHTSSFCFRPPLRNMSYYHACRWLEKVGRWCWPYCGGVYEVIVKKQVAGMHPFWQGLRAKTETATEGNSGQVNPARGQMRQQR